MLVSGAVRTPRNSSARDTTSPWWATKSSVVSSSCGPWLANDLTLEYHRDYWLLKSCTLVLNVSAAPRSRGLAWRRLAWRSRHGVDSQLPVAHALATDWYSASTFLRSRTIILVACPPRPKMFSTDIFLSDISLSNILKPQNRVWGSTPPRRA